MSCVACDNQRLSEAFTARDINNRPFDFMTCQQCGTLQIAQFDSQLLDYAYQKSYYGGSDNKFKWPFSSLFGLSKSLAAQKIARLMDNKQARIIDIGCGKGDLLEKLHGIGYTQLWGNDIEKPKNLPTHIQWVSGALPELKADHQPFDLINLTHVFEHLAAPKTIIGELYKKLKSGGLILLSQPNIQSRQAQRYRELWLHLDPPRHLHLIPPVQLIQMFTEAGFELVSRKEDSPLYNPFGYVQSWLNKRIGQRDLLYEFLKRRGRARGPKQFFQLLLSVLFAGVSFPVYFLIDRSEAKKGQSGTIEFVFRKK